MYCNKNTKLTLKLNKLHYIFPLLLLIAFQASAQTVDFNKVAMPFDQRAKTFEDYLVQLAWHNSPQNRILNTEVQIADNEVKLEKKEWTRDIQASFNINEISLSTLIYGDELDIPVFYPVYNFTASINLGTFVNRKANVQNKEFEKLIAEEKINEEKLSLRRNVLERYEEHLSSIELLTIRIQSEESAYQAYTLLSEQFRTGRADLEEYTRASDLYFSAKEGRQEAESKVRITRIALEELIGISYEKAKKLGPKEGQNK